MAVSISPKTVYVIRDTNHPSEKHEIEGWKGLQKYREEVLGGLVDRIHSTCWTGNPIKTKQELFKFFESNRTDFKTIFDLLDEIDEIKRELEDDE